MFKKDRSRCIRTRSLANIQKKLVKLAMVMRTCLQNQVTQTTTRRDSLIYITEGIPRDKKEQLEIEINVLVQFYK